MAKKSKVGLKVPTANEMAKKYGSMIKLASEVTDTDLYIPSTFFALNYLFGKGIPQYVLLNNLYFLFVLYKSSLIFQHLLVRSY